MNKIKIIGTMFFFAGVLLLFLSIIFTFMKADKLNIIGGAGFSTFWFVFSNQNGGIYFIFAAIAIVLISSSIIMFLIDKKRNHK